MAWNCYITIFKAEAPVHIGYKQVGILKTTRYYITGRAMWGAITANLTRALFNYPKAEDYRDIGDFVRENIRTTYFYPAIRKNEMEDPENWNKYETDNYLVFLPKYTQEGIKFGEKIKEEFEQSFVGSFVSTALDSGTKTAEEGSLHEFEFIKNKVKIGNKTVDTYWVGYLFVKEKAENKKVEIEKCKEEDVIIKRVNNNKRVELRNVLSLIHVGGEKNYGLGKLKLIAMQKTNGKVFGKFDFELSNKYPIIKNLNVLVAHAILNKIRLELGEIEPLVGLEWSGKGAGQSVSTAVICITPGSKISGKYALGEYGLIKCLTNE